MCFTERKLQEESRAKSLRVETARNIWEGGVPLKDTLGEAYLVDHRGIPSDVLSRWGYNSQLIFPITSTSVCSSRRLSLQFLEPGAVYVEFDVMGMKQKKVNNGPALLVPVEDHQVRILTVVVKEITKLKLTTSFVCGILLKRCLHSFLS